MFNTYLKLSAKYLLLTLIALVFILPVVFMVVSSLKPDVQLLQDSSSIRAFLPVGDISFENYVQAWQRVPVLQFLTNSILVTGLTLVLSLFICSMAAFSFVFLSFRGKNLLLSIILATFIVPFETIAIPLLMIVNNLPWIGLNGFEMGWMDSYHVQVIPFIADALTIFLFVQFFKDIPIDIVEAARVDGAGWFKIYHSMVLPLAGPIIATAAILKFLVMYNQYVWPLMTTQSESYRPVMVGIQYFFLLDVAWGEVMAYLSVITVPVLLFYLALQKAFISSIAATGVKG